MRARGAQWVAALWLLGLSLGAEGGGFELLGNGTEALGRGGAFTAKADDPTALDYNVAGLARQRGTQLLFDSNVIFNRYQFQRAGRYPDSPADVPYGGMPFPGVRSSGAAYVPFVALTTDFGRLKRWTLAVGLFGPSAVGQREYRPQSATGPAPQRYDLIKSDLLILYPTLAVGFAATRWLDLGLALELAYASFDFSSASFVDLGPLCTGPEDASCETTTRLRTSGLSATAALGVMLHPRRDLQLGLAVRGPVDLSTSGTVDGTPPRAMPVPLPSDKAQYHTRLPWVVRAGARYRFRRGDGFERGDVELDVVYEAWSAAQGVGDSIKVPHLGLFTDLSPTVVRHYRDTVSVRLGGAYNLPLLAGVLSLRGGAYVDTAATADKDTRLDFDTMTKYAATAGLGYRVRGVTLAVAYAYVYEPDRNVQDGALRLLNGANHGQPLGTGGPTPVINNGRYQAWDQLLSIGLTVGWEQLLRRPGE